VLVRIRLQIGNTPSFATGSSVIRKRSEPVFEGLVPTSRPVGSGLRVWRRLWMDYGELERNPTCLVTRITGHVPYQDSTWPVAQLSISSDLCGAMGFRSNCEDANRSHLPPSLRMLNCRLTQCRRGTRPGGQHSPKIQPSCLANHKMCSSLRGYGEDLSIGAASDPAFGSTNWCGE
jgi:hypothetical protein